MSLDTRKLDVINWISGLNDESILVKIERLKPIKQDWWEMITDEEKAEIQEGLEQADKNEVVTTEEVLSKYEKWDTK